MRIEIDSKSVAHAQEGMREILTVLSRHVSGDITLNQLRVLQFINLCWVHRKTATNHREICNELGLPPATVSRAIAKFIETGIVTEEVDPADGRKRLVIVTGVIPDAPNDNLDLELAELAARYADSTRR